MNIALLEDNPAILDYMSTALRMAGHNVYTHVEIPSLLAALFDQEKVCSLPPYDLVIVDLLLPGDMSGVEAIDRIRQSIPPETLPIVIVSACSQDELAQVKARFPDIPAVRKPFKMSKLLQTINQLKPA
ncbi:MAG TPA: response regulator [Ktedonobacteraceae bacterium]|nr:response regulator [Ktedonobacteraceae bacterium]